MKNNKKLLIIVSNVNSNKSIFKKQLVKALKKSSCELTMTTFDDIYIEIGETESKMTFGGKDIKDFDLVYFRGVNKRCSMLVSTICQFLDEYNINYIDRAWKDIGPRGDKLTFLVKLNFGGVPVPKTVYFAKTTEDKFSLISKKLDLPFVAKDLNKQRGRGIYLINNLKDFQKLLKLSESRTFSRHVFQKYIENYKEYRLLVLGENTRVWEEKISQEGEFRSNVALGAKEKFMPINDVPKKYSDIAILASKILNIQIAGVDIVIEKGTNKMYIFEVNRGPGFTYDNNDSDEIKELAAYLSKKN